jgi:fused signal recognition particle receptor
MTKQNKLFSWLGFGKKAEAAPVETAAEQQVQPVEQQADVVPAKEVVEVVVAEAESEPEAPLPASTPVEIVPAPVAVPALQPQPAERPGFFARLKQGLTKTSQNLGNGLASLFLGKKIDDDLYEELETQLLMADVGVDTSQKLIKQLVQHANRKQLKDADALFDKLQQEMALLLDDVEQPLQLKGADGPFVILMVGVNGVGKTTTIGKMAQQFKQQGKSVMLAAGDTFRAAAVEQLQVWGERNAIPVIAQHSGADSASVIFDAYQAAKARGVDVLIADTAGRLQNKAHLMEELKKIVRVMKKIDANAPHEVMLTLDAGTGQNALSQARLFKEAVDISGISLTKLDGTAKGGVIFAIADQFKLPIRYIGVGEGIDDLRVFDSKDFIKALFARDL